MTSTEPNHTPTVEGECYDCPACGWSHVAHPEYGWQRHDDRAVKVHRQRFCPAPAYPPRTREHDDQTPRALYHWSPAANRTSITEHGLRPGGEANDGDWTPPHVCYATTPSEALALTHGTGDLDLWMVRVADPSQFTVIDGEWRTTEPMQAWWCGVRHRYADQNSTLPAEAEAGPSERMIAGTAQHRPFCPEPIEHDYYTDPDPPTAEHLPVYETDADHAFITCSCGDGTFRGLGIESDLVDFEQHIRSLTDAEEPTEA